MKIDTLPDNLKEKWYQAARDTYSKAPLETLRDYELEALIWYHGLQWESWEIQPPESYEEALMWHELDYASARAKFEHARRSLERAERWLKDWQSKRRSAEESRG